MLSLNTQTLRSTTTEPLSFPPPVGRRHFVPLPFMDVSSFLMTLLSSARLCDLDVGRREKGPARPAGRQCVHGRQPGRDSQDAQVEHAQDFDTGQPPGGGVQSPAIRRSRSSTARHHLPLTPSSLSHTLSHAALTVAVSTVRPRTRAPLSHTLSHTHAAWMASTSTLHPRARARKVISTPQVGRARESMPRGHPRTT